MCPEKQKDFVFRYNGTIFDDKKKLYIKAFVSKLKLSPNLQQNVIKIFQNKNKENTNYFKIIVINFFL